MKQFYLEDGSKVSIDDSKPIGTGGEGSVYKLAKNSNILAKIYNQRALDRMPEIEDKIKTMVSKKPGLLDYNGLTIIAWPTAILYDIKGKFIGYIMHKISASNHLSHVITPGLQKKKFAHITWYDRLVIAINLSLVMSYIHKNDTVIGDINTSDFFVYPGFEIGVVDTDSFQIIDQQKMFHCKVFTPDYTPPEVIEAKKKYKGDTLRTPDSDNYGLAILIFQILMMGVHPFSARINQVLGFDGNAINYCMENEIFPYATKEKHIKPPKNAMPFVFFPKYLQELFEKAFKPYHVGNVRPTATEWVLGLRQLKENLKKCKKSKYHYYPNHFKKCPLCAKEQTKDYDYLLDFFHMTSNHLVKYETNMKPIYMDEGHAQYDTVLGHVYNLQRRSRQAMIFKNLQKEKYQLDDRIKDIYAQQKLLKKFNCFHQPLQLIYKDQHIIGYTFKSKGKLYKLSEFLKANRLEKTKITHKSKIILAKNIAEMFDQLEKHKIPIEFHQIFVDQDLNPYIPDLVMLKSTSDHFMRMTMQLDSYKPYEYYLNKIYKSYLESKEKERLEAEKIYAQAQKDAEARALKDAEARALKDAEAQANAEASDEKTYEPAEKEHFSFEKSKPLNQLAKDDKVNIPIAIETYDFEGIQTVRFHLAVIIHTILNQTHPYQGILQGVKKPIQFFIEHNMYMHEKYTQNVEISDLTTPIEVYPNYYAKAMKQALWIKDPLKINRPSSNAWQNVLSRMLIELKKCSKSDYHFYHHSYLLCPMCHQSEVKTHDEMRHFINYNKKRWVYYVLQFNLVLNKIVVLSVLMFILFYVHSVSVGNESLISAIDWQQKVNDLKSLVGIDRVTQWFDDAIKQVVKWFEFIFGGGSS